MSTSLESTSGFATPTGEHPQIRSGGASKRIATAITAVAILAIGVLGAHPAYADEVSGVPGLENSVSVDGPTIFDGQLVARSGAGVAGQKVVLYAWPTASALAKLADGEVVKKAAVGYAETAQDGRFALKISDASLLGHYRDADGNINFGLVSASPSGLFTYNFVSAADSKSPSAFASVARGTSAVVLAPAEDVSPRYDETRLPDDVRPVDKACGTVRNGDIGNFWVTVGYGYVTGSNASMNFSYTSGASSSLGVGMSISGAGGTFSASGTSSVSSSSTVSYPATGSFKGWQSQFFYGKFRTICTEGSLVVADYYEAKPVSFSGGASVQTISGAPAATYCTSYVSGSSFTKNTTTAYTGTAGVGSSGTLGVNLSATTGYSSQASLKFTFSSAGQLCGTNGYPGATPSRLVAK